MCVTTTKKYKSTIKTSTNDDLNILKVEGNSQADEKRFRNVPSAGAWSGFVVNPTERRHEAKPPRLVDR